VAVVIRPQVAPVAIVIQPFQGCDLVVVLNLYKHVFWLI